MCDCLSADEEASSAKFIPGERVSTGTCTRALARCRKTGNHPLDYLWIPCGKTLAQSEATGHSEGRLRIMRHNAA